MRLLLAALWVLLPISAWATCPANPSDCPSPTFHNMTVNGAITATGSTLSGGTQTGANVSGNNVTATGGSAARTEAAWQADRSNVLAQSGTDPSGSTSADNSVQINAAAAISSAATGRLKDVYVPAGIYYIKHQITLSSGQCLIGDSRGNTYIKWGADFDSTATSIVKLSQGGLDPGPCIRDVALQGLQPNVDATTTTTAISAGGTNTITVADPSKALLNGSVTDATATAAIPALTTITNIVGNVITLSNNIVAPGVGGSDSIHFGPSRTTFATLAAGCTTGVGGTGCKYPPVIQAANNSSRYKLQNVRISGAWDGVDSNGINAVWWIDDLEMEAFNIGLHMGGTKDASHIHGFHFWDFDTQSSSLLFTNVYEDGGMYAAQFAEMDALNVADWAVFEGRVAINSASFWGHFSNMMMDGNNSTLEVTNSAWLQISNFYATGHATGSNTHCQIDIAGGENTISNVHLNSTSVAICVSGGINQVYGGRLFAANTASGLVSHSGGAFTLQGLRFAQAAGAWTAPLISSTSVSGGLGVIGNRFQASAGDVGGVVIGTDAANVVVVGNNFNGWGFTIPGYLGTYTPNDTAPAIVEPPDATVSGGSIAIGNAAYATAPLTGATQNTVMGYHAMGEGTLTAASVQNTAYGYKTMAKATSGAANNASGFQALTGLTSGADNSAFGAGALASITTANSNTGLGRKALNAAISASNTGVGAEALSVSTSGAFNTALGASAGLSVTTGASNLILGPAVGSTTLTTGSNNILIGTSSAVDTPAASTGSMINIGNSLQANNATLTTSRTAPTISAGFCSSPTIPNANGTWAFTINVGTACGGSTGTLSISTAANGWVCNLVAVTAPDTRYVAQTGGSASTVTMTSYSRTTGAPTNFTDSDVIRGSCFAY